jgi:hypothetical protein
MPEQQTASRLRQDLELTQTVMVPAERPGFSRRLAALANATDIKADMSSKTQKTPDLARRKAVGCNPLLGALATRIICELP